jgi:predicted RNA-binding protein
MEYYIFNVMDQKIGDKEISGYDIFLKRMEQKRWGLGERTANRKRVKPGDRVIFYRGGEDGKAFIGSAEIISDASELEEDSIANVDTSYYSVKLDNINIFPEPKSIYDFVDKLEFIQNPDNWGAYLQGGTRRISESDYKLILGDVSNISRSSGQKDLENEAEFVLEKYLEEFIVSNWDKINFKRDLKIFEDEDGNTGQQYLTDVGYIDILAKDKEGNFFVIELKKGKTGDIVVGQTMRYMGWVQENLAGNNDVYGIVVAPELDKKISYALKLLPGKIELYTYKASFSLEKV